MDKSSPDDQDPKRSMVVVYLFEKHFGKCYLILVTVLGAFIVFAATTGSYVPLWAAVGTGTGSLIALYYREQRRRNGQG